MQGSSLDRLTELLQQVEGGVTCLSNETIWFVHDNLLKTAARLRTVHNDRQPILRLPVEILRKILSDVPESSIGRWRFVNSIWRSTAVDSSMLLPVSQSCRRLREIALDHHALWANIELSKHSRVFLPTFVQRSQQAPLMVGGSSMEELAPALGMFYATEAYRIRELCLCGVTSSDLTYVYDLLKQPLPSLESFSLQCYLVREGWKDRAANLPWSPAHCPRLRRLYLKDTPFLIDTGFPSLTHLAFSCIDVANVHSRVAKVLSQCPLLETVILDQVLSETDPRIEDIDKPLPLEHLKRVTLSELSPKTVQFYQALLQPCGRESAYHMLDYPVLEPPFPANFIPPQSRENPMRLCISLHPGRHGSFRMFDHVVTMILATNECTRRVTTYPGRSRGRGGDPPLWVSQPMSSLDIREVWIVNVAGSYPWPPSLLVLSALETVVLVTDHTYFPAERPSLHLLPSIQDPAFNAPKLTTVRVACGYSDYAVACEHARDRGEITADKLDLRVVLEELASGAYGYIQHIVLQITLHLSVNEADVERLREYVPTVEVERVAELPSMPVWGDDPERSTVRLPGALY